MECTEIIRFDTLRLKGIHVYLVLVINYMLCVIMTFVFRMHSVLSFADEPLQNSTLRPRRYFGNVASVTGSPPAALPALNYEAFKSPDSHGAQHSTSKPSNNVMAAESMQFIWENVETSKHLTSTTLPAVDSPPPSLQSLMPSKPVLGSNQQIETTAKLTSDWKVIGTNSPKDSVAPTPVRYQHPDPDTSLTISGFSSLTASQLILNSGQKFVPNHHQKGVSEQTLAMTTSLPGHPLHSANLTMDDSPINQSYNLDMSRSSDPVDWNQPADHINTLPHQDEVLAPEYNVPFILPHPITPSFEPTDLSPDEFYPTNTMEIDWGSGDYLETMTFLDSDGEDYSPVTKVVSDAYDLEDYTESYNTAFPSRVGIFPSSLQPLHVSPTPSLRTYSTPTPLESMYASSSPFTVHYTLKPTPTHRIPHVSDADWTDTFTIQPTDVLLPDMNSLEYYTTQLTRENNSMETAAEHRNISTMSINPTEITSTSSFIDTKFSEEANSGEPSGFEPRDESTTALTKEESPQRENASVAFLDPSIVPTPFFNSSSSWDGQVSTTDWLTPALTPGIDSTLLPAVTPLLPDNTTSYSSLTDVHWFVTESVHQSSTHSTLFLTSTMAFFPVPTTSVTSTTSGTIEVTTQDSSEQMFNISLLSTETTIAVTSPNILSDEGESEDWTDIPVTMTLIPPSSDTNTVSDMPVTPTATNTSHQDVTTTAATAVAATDVNIISSTSRKTATTVTTLRQYSCNVNRPVYLVKVGKNQMHIIYNCNDYFTLLIKLSVYHLC